MTNILFQSSWISDVKDKLANRDMPKDVASAEELLKQHQDLRDEINANRDKWVIRTKKSCLFPVTLP